MSSKRVCISAAGGGQEDWAEDDCLERRQTARRDPERSLCEDQDADLTELTAPAPVSRTCNRGDSLEIEETEARREQKLETNSEGGEEDLTETAAPVPIERCRTHKDAKKAEGAESLSTDALDDPEQGKKPGSDRSGHFYALTELYIHSHLIFFSIIGTLARIGLEAINAYPNTPFTSPVLWANLGGSLFLGFLTEDRKIFREEWGFRSEEWSFHPTKLDDSDEDTIRKLRSAHGKVKETIPLFIGLAVGFCGSFTSFSSLIRDAFLAAINELESRGSGTPSSADSNPHRSGGYSFEAILAVLIIQVAVSISALKFGASTALALDRWMPIMSLSLVRRCLDPLIVVIGFGCWIGAISMSIWPPENAWRGQVTFALVFAPLGCLLRFHVSKFLNTRFPSFPLGTFCVNVFGTIVLGMCYDLRHPDVGGSVTGCQILVGVMEGFCGCLTTVSTWVLELDTLRRRHAYIYGITSLSVPLGFIAVIIGSLEWTRGLSRPACSV